MNVARVQSFSSALPPQGRIAVGYTAGSASAGRPVPSEHTADTIALDVEAGVKEERIAQDDFAGTGGAVDRGGLLARHDVSFDSPETAGASGSGSASD